MTQIMRIVSKCLFFVPSVCLSFPKDWFVFWLLYVALGGFGRLCGSMLK